MAQQAPLSSRWLRVLHRKNLGRLLFLQATLSTTAAAQAPPQQYVYGSVPVTTATSQISAYGKNGANGTLTGVTGAPFADSLQGGAMAIDGLGHFLFVINPSTLAFFYRSDDKSSNGSHFSDLHRGGKIRPVPVCGLPVWQFCGPRRH